MHAELYEANFLVVENLRCGFYSPLAIFNNLQLCRRQKENIGLRIRLAQCKPSSKEIVVYKNFLHEIYININL